MTATLEKKCGTTHKPPIPCEGDAMAFPFIFLFLHF